MGDWLKTFARPALTVLAITIAVPAAAATSITFDTLPSGTTVTDNTLIGVQYAALGVTFTGTYGNGATGLPVATNYAGGPAGPNYSGNFLGNSTSGQFYQIVNGQVVFIPRYQTVSILFTNGANDISLSHNDFATQITTTFNAYDAVGTLLQTFTVNDGGGWALRSLAAEGVYRLDLVVTTTATTALAYNVFGVDNLTFTALAGPTGSVPEPASRATMIAGLGLIGGALRRRVVSVRFA